jgi:hypothetical protein
LTALQDKARAPMCTKLACMCKITTRGSGQACRQLGVVAKQSQVASWLHATKQAAGYCRCHAQQCNWADAECSCKPREQLQRQINVGVRAAPEHTEPAFTCQPGRLTNACKWAPDNVDGSLPSPPCCWPGRGPAADWSSSISCTPCESPGSPPPSTSSSSSVSFSNTEFPLPSFPPSGVPSCIRTPAPLPLSGPRCAGTAPAGTQQRSGGEPCESVVQH